MLVQSVGDFLQTYVFFDAPSGELLSFCGGHYTNPAAVWLNVFSIDTLIRRFVRFVTEPVYSTVADLFATFDWTQWYLMPTCMTLRRPWTGPVHDKAAKLPSKMRVSLETGSTISQRSYQNQITSRTNAGSAENSASTRDDPVAFCNLKVQNHRATIDAKYIASTRTSLSFFTIQIFVTPCIKPNLSRAEV